MTKGIREDRIQMKAMNKSKKSLDHLLRNDELIDQLGDIRFDMNVTEYHARKRVKELVKFVLDLDRLLEVRRKEMNRQGKVMDSLRKLPGFSKPSEKMKS
jgi:hypothetical protein